MASLKIDTYGNEKQKEAFKILLNSNGITDLGYGGGAGGGKSYTGVVWQWILRNKYPGTRGFFGRKELKRLKQTTLATYFKFLDDYKIPKTQRGNYNAQDSVIKFENGSEILLLDLSYMPSDPLYTRFGSLELTDGFADEIAEIESQCLMILKTRIGRQKNEEYGLEPKFLGTFNPDKGHVYRDYYKPYKEGNLPHYRVFIPALATDNKKLPKTYIEQLKKADEVTQQRLLYGNFDYDDTPGRLFDYNSILNLWNNEPINGEMYMSIDVARAGKDKTIAFVWNGLEIVDIIKENKSDLSELSKKIKLAAQDKEIPLRNIIADENGVGGGLIDNLRCQGFINNARPLQPKKANLSTTRNYDNLKTQCYFKLADYVNSGKIKISIIDQELKDKLTEELDILVQVDIDKDGKTKLLSKEDVKEKIGRSPDFSDALMMRMYYELANKPTIEDEEEKEDNGDPFGIFIDDEEIEFEDIESNPYY